MVVFFTKASHCPTLSLPSYTCMHLKLNLAEKERKQLHNSGNPS